MPGVPNNYHNSQPKPIESLLEEIKKLNRNLLEINRSVKLVVEHQNRTHNYLTKELQGLMNPHRVEQDKPIKGGWFY